VKRWLIVGGVVVAAFIGAACFGVLGHDSSRTLFVKRFFVSPREVGSLLPSSPRLAAAIAHDLPQGQLLEIGPGVGTFTEAIVAKMGKEDRLDLVEIDPAFCRALERRFARDPRVTVHQASILEWSPGYTYDGIVSGLPLNAFSTEEVEEILAQYEHLMAEGGQLAYFEYVGIPALQRSSLVGDAGSHARAVRKLKQRFYEEYGVGEEIVWLNAPPARVRYCQKLP
jgi:phosphatidylethanolamine/phosphatidyl-N-methylethanolamine N-methyltransferase